VNLGPGDITLEMAVVRMQPALLAWLKKEEGLRLAVHEFKNGLNAQLPIKLAVAEKMMISFPIEENCILDQHPLRIGLRDTYGRAHWVPVKDLKKAQRDYSEYKASLETRHKSF
jgi:hypothetical protein